MLFRSGIDDTFTFAGRDDTHDWVQIMCPKFAAFLTDQFSPVDILLKHFDTEEIKPVVDYFFKHYHKK